MNIRFSIPRLLTAAGAAAALALGSCAYDPYYSDVSYSSGQNYGYGHGYGGSSFSTSVLISTGNPRWGYDPYSYAYYDYTRRAYYDPYLYGYYPVGYRPPLVVGVPHPHGWRRGRTMPPPSRIRSNNLSNYQNRHDAYRRTDYSWARQVRDTPVRPTSYRDRDNDNRGGSPFRGRDDNRGGSPFGGRDDNRPGARFPQQSPTQFQGRDSRPGRNETQIPNRFTSGGRTESPGVPASYNRPISVQPDRQPERRPERQVEQRRSPFQAPAAREREAPQVREAPSRGMDRGSMERSSRSDSGPPSSRGFRGGDEGRRSR